MTVKFNRPFSAFLNRTVVDTVIYLFPIKSPNTVLCHISEKDLFTSTEILISSNRILGRIFILMKFSHPRLIKSRLLSNTLPHYFIHDVTDLHNTISSAFNCKRNSVERCSIFYFCTSCHINAWLFRLLKVPFIF